MSEPHNPDSVEVVVWRLEDPAMAVWFLLCSDPKLGMVVRVRTRPMFRVDGHHLSGTYQESAVMWTEKMERNGLFMSRVRYMHEVDRQRLLQLQFQLATESAQLDEPGGLMESLLDEVVNQGRAEPW